MLRNAITSSTQEIYQTALHPNNHKTINDKHFNILREEFTEQEISELCSFISFITACQKLGRIYNLTENYQQNKAVTIAELNG